MESPFRSGYLRKVDHNFYSMREGVNRAPGALSRNGDRAPTTLK